MTLWRQFYVLIWLAFLQIIIVVLLPFSVYLVGFHVVLGLAILGLAYSNNRAIKKTQAPDRLKRVVKTTAILATVQPIFGILLFFALTYSWGNITQLIIQFLHVTIALAIISQASSVATAYDMWEEHEFVTPPISTPSIS